MFHGRCKLCAIEPFPSRCVPAELENAPKGSSWAAVGEGRAAKGSTDCAGADTTEEVAAKGSASLGGVAAAVFGPSKRAAQSSDCSFTGGLALSCTASEDGAPNAPQFGS